MNFSKKIFISILSVSFFVSLLICTSFYFIFKNEIKNDFMNYYKIYGETIATTFHYLELTSDLANKNAVYLLSNIVDKGEIPADKDLAVLAKKFGVNGFYIIKSDGKFIRSSDIPIENQKNSLFSYSQEYKKLINGNVNIAITPIIPSYPYDVPAKLTMISNQKRNLILESSTHLEFIGKILHKIISSDKNINSVGLYAPTGYELGSVSSSGLFQQGRRSVFNNTELPNSRDSFVLSFRIKTITDKCIECIKKGVSEDGDYYYILKMNISLNPLIEKISALTIKIILIFIVILMVSVYISGKISKKLVQRINLINETANDIIKNKNLNLKVNIQGNDEISRFAETFNKMLIALNESQTKIIEAEKIKSINSISMQFAHDIRSPLAAIEIILKTSNIEPLSSYILSEAIQDVRKIADNLLNNQRNLIEKNNLLSENIKPILFRSLLEAMVLQKKKEWGCEEFGIYLEMDDQSKSIWIDGRKNEIKCIISNLLNNAYESLEEERNIKISIKNTNKYLQVNISDTGAGIPPEKLNDVLNGMSLKHNGRGMGLSTAKKYMEESGGRLHLTSCLGKGTSVILEFVIAKQTN